MKGYDFENIKDIVFFVCVTTVLVTWSLTSYYENIKKSEINREISLEAIKSGYVECYYKPGITFITVWKKSCDEK